MIGSPQHTVFSDGVLRPFYAPLGGDGRKHIPDARGMANFNRVFAPWIADAISGQLADVSNFGRGLLRVSNKRSEVNILNSVPRAIVVTNVPPPQRSLNTPRILSRRIPLGLGGS